MSDIAPLLIEIGSAELPPKALEKLAKALRDTFTQGLKAAQLNYEQATYYATPRRLAIRIDGLSAVQPSQTVERRGPALQAAYDANGQPTPACLGFAKSCGIDVSALTTLETDKGQWVTHTETRVGKTVFELVPSILQQAVTQLPIPKRMRWGSHDFAFVRPVQWLLALYGDTPIDCDLLGQHASNLSYGHRSHHPEAITINHPDDYLSALLNAKVMVDIEQRRTLIQHQARQLAQKMTVTMTQSLLDEVTALVEWPQPLMASFDQTFLEVPAEALIAAMQDHQRYFPMLNEEGKLAPYFITVANIESTDIERVKTGNERVMRARLADAAFFYQTDKTQSLMQRRNNTKKVLLQRGLGSLYDKSERLIALCNYLSQQLGNDAEATQRAATLAKCDLMTDMVGEFPELQGVMGQYYARHDGETDAVCTAIREHYLPRFAGDNLPTHTTGTLLALADRIDHLVGVFGIHQQPSGVKDPYKLRRAALGVVRLIIEKQLPLDLPQLLQQAYTHYQANAETPLANTETLPQVHKYISERLRHWYQEQGVPFDVTDAVLAIQNQDLYDTQARSQAVLHFKTIPEAQALIAANKRVNNILRKADHIPSEYKIELLSEPAEQALADAIDNNQTAITTLVQQKDYAQALTHLATLRESVDTFFDQVMVMTDDTDLRDNRLALLQALHRQFNWVADITRLQEVL